MVKYKEVKIETEPFTESQIDEDLKKVDFVYHLQFSKMKKIKKWLKEHKIELFFEEEIVYIHRYPSDKDTLIGVKRLTELTYFIQAYSIAKKQRKSRVKINNLKVQSKV